jgi:large subunit ribosomal protein L10
MACVDGAPLEILSEKATTGTRERLRRQDGAAMDRKRQEPRAEFTRRSAMALNLSQKQEVVAELAGIAAKAHSLVAAEYAGTTVEQMTAMRKKARETGVYLRVVKNTLASRAVAGTEYECVQDALVGPLLYAFSTEEPGAAGRLIKEFAKGNEKLVAKVVSVEGKLLPAAHVDVLASLPTRAQALAMLARVLAEPAAMFARAIKAVADQQGGGEASAEAEAPTEPTPETEAETA